MMDTRKQAGFPPELSRRRLLHFSGVSAVLAGPLRISGQTQASGDVREILARELRRSRPDYVTYVPGHWDGSTHDGLNEHFLVFDGPDGWLLAVWTQSDRASGPPGSRQKNRIVFSRSADGGVRWEKPAHVVGPRTEDDPAPMASWAFPLVSKKGRIYVLYNQHTGVRGWIEMHTGVMAGVFSDDNGRSWSASQEIPMPPHPMDDPEGKIPPEWIVWQLPMRDLRGGYFVGYTRWASPARAYYKKVANWTEIESVCEFMRFENIDENPLPEDIRIRYSAWGEKALRVPYYKDPLLGIAQEPSIVRLPDRRLFSVMRTNSGCVWYSVSADDGANWCSPRPLLRKDFGQPILQPVGCCPIYQLADGRYVLLHHNNIGDRSEGGNPAFPRYPAYIALGEFRPAADQPLWFSESRILMDTEGVTVNGLKESRDNRMNTGIGLYSSFTTRGGNNVLWHPDRKFFLVGKKITAEFLAGLAVPGGLPPK